MEDSRICHECGEKMTLQTRDRIFNISNQKGTREIALDNVECYVCTNPECNEIVYSEKQVEDIEKRIDFAYKELMENNNVICECGTQMQESEDEFKIVIGTHYQELSINPVIKFTCPKCGKFKFNKNDILIGIEGLKRVIKRGDTVEYSLYVSCKDVDINEQDKTI